MDTQRLRVGVIGAGIGAMHLAAYRQLPRVEIVAIAGLDDDRVRQVAAEYSVPQTYREYEQLLAAPGIDAVSVCLPNLLHAPVSIAALQAGKHVLVEKPLARNVDESLAMIGAARWRPWPLKHWLFSSAFRTKRLKNMKAAKALLLGILPSNSRMPWKFHKRIMSCLPPSPAVNAP